ncbi:MAG: hypothetical protein RL708_1184 [Bacteroidota bacterium]|jgi:hypothetical protein
MKNNILLLCLFIFPQLIFAESDLLKSKRVSTRYTAFEVGLHLGESHYYGDLSKGIIQFKNIHKEYGAFIKYQRGRNWVYKFQYSQGNLSGNDAYNKANLIARNLNFQSPLKEYALMLEYNYPEFTACRQYNWSLYGTIGIALFHFRPSNKYGDLRALSTEGQGTSAYPNRKKYWINQPSIPVGVGIKFIPLKKIIIGFEMGLRKTFTDYIDDVSKTYPNPAILLEEKGPTSVAASFPGKYKYPNNNPTDQVRGNPASKDYYFISFAYISYVFMYDCESEKHRYNDVGGCKSF